MLESHLEGGKIVTGGRKLVGRGDRMENGGFRIRWGDRRRAQKARINGNLQLVEVRNWWHHKDMPKTCDGGGFCKTWG